MINIDSLMVLTVLVFGQVDPGLNTETGECFTDNIAFAAAVQDAVISRDLEFFHRQGVDEGMFENGQFSPNVECHLYGGADCVRWLNPGFRSVFDILNHSTTIVWVNCLKDECAASYIIERNPSIRSYDAKDYMQVLATTVIIESSGCWRLTTPFFHAGAGNPFASEYG